MYSKISKGERHKLQITNITICLVTKYCYLLIGRHKILFIFISWWSKGERVIHRSVGYVFIPKRTYKWSPYLWRSTRVSASFCTRSNTSPCITFYFKARKQTGRNVEKYIWTYSNQSIGEKWISKNSRKTRLKITALCSITNPIFC